VRSYNCLKREGIHQVGELVARSEADLLDIRNFGAKSIDEVKLKLAQMGLALKDSPPGFDPSLAAGSYSADYADEYGDEYAQQGGGVSFSDDDTSFQETEQL
jgi:DNA-directed RNA polymerase subunit alpha